MIGIYRIRNQVNGKVYIGQSVNLKKRKAAHFSRLKNQTHDNPYLQAAWNKYGESNFDFSVICICDGADLADYEDLYMKHYSSLNSTFGYNLLFVDLETKTNRHSEETKEKLRQINLGKKQSPELVEKRISKIRGVKRPTRSKEHCEAISLAKSVKTFQLYDPQNNLVEITGLSRFCKEYGLDDRSIARVLNREPSYKQHKGWTLEPKPVLVNPEGLEFVVVNGTLTRLADEFNLDISTLAKLVKGKINKYKNWRVK